ncbi:MAG: hypothetical protein WD552_01645 [Candidatus Paceibacterota bacterium]
MGTSVAQNKQPQSLNPKAQNLLVKLEKYEAEFSRLQILRPCPFDEWHDYVDLLGEEKPKHDVAAIYLFRPTNKAMYKGAVYLFTDSETAAICVSVQTEDEYAVRRSGPNIFHTASNSPLSFVLQKDLEEKGCSYCFFNSYEEAFGRVATFCWWSYNVNVKGKEPNSVVATGTDNDLPRLTPGILSQVKQHHDKLIPEPR